MFFIQVNLVAFARNELCVRKVTANWPLSMGRQRHLKARLLLCDIYSSIIVHQSPGYWVKTVRFQSSHFLANILLDICFGISPSTLSPPGNSSFTPHRAQCSHSGPIILKIKRFHRMPDPCLFY